jgi:hypothetical protein
MKKLAWHKPILLLLLVGVLLLGSAACTAEGRELAMAWFEEWAKEKDVSWLRTTGRWLTGYTTGDEDVDAALDAGRAIKDIKEADELMDQGQQAQQAGDLDTAAKKMDEAIKKRPEDWTYKISRGVVELLQEDYDSREEFDDSAWSGAIQQDLANGHSYFDKEDDRKGTDGPAFMRYLNQSIQEHEQVKQTLESSGFKSDKQAWTTYGDLSRFYKERADRTGSAEDRAKEFEYYNLAWK